MKLSALELCLFERPYGDHAGVYDVIELAVSLDTLGYKRFWLGEHHTWCADASPELLATAIATQTQNMTIGVGGILLDYYNPVKIASSFLLLEAIFPSRINLGICRGRARALTNSGWFETINTDDPLLFEKKTSELLSYFQTNEEVYPSSSAPHFPEVWLLGTGSKTMQLAAQQGLCYSHSLFHNGSIKDPAIFSEYHKTFRPSLTNKHSSPSTILAVAGFCAETTKQAQDLMNQHHNDHLVPNVVGNPIECRNALLKLGEYYGVDEIIFCDLCTNMQNHRQSYELLAKAFL